MPKLPVQTRIAGAPISWGVCEAPGWGHEMPASRVLSEMASVGLRATELGPAGYLGSTPAAVRARLAEHDLRLVGGFVPVPLHVDEAVDLSEATDAIAILAAAGAEVVVLAARSPDGSYDHKVPVTDRQWPILLANLDRLRAIAANFGLTTTLHPHVGTAIESRASVLRLLQDSDVQLCLDTGHLLIGGTEPLDLVERFTDRVSHVHLKDVRAGVAGTVAAGNTAYQDAVRAGLYAPLGDGDVDIAGIVAALEAAGYQGWYVMEQDTAFDREPADGTGPISDVRRSVEFLLSVAGKAPGVSAAGR